MVKSIMASRPGNEAAKQSQTITLLSPCLTVSMHSWSNFGRSATPGKVHPSSVFSPFVHNSSHCGSLESQSLRDGFITLSRLIDVNDFASHQLCFFEIYWKL